MTEITCLLGTKDPTCQAEQEAWEATSEIWPIQGAWDLGETWDLRAQEAWAQIPGIWAARATWVVLEEPCHVTREVARVTMATLLVVAGIMAGTAEQVGQTTGAPGLANMVARA